MTPEQQALRAAYMAELWPTCREVPRGDRAEKRQSDRRAQRVLKEMQTIHHPSTGCAETGGQKTSPDAA